MDIEYSQELRIGIQRFVMRGRLPHYFGHIWSTDKYNIENLFFVHLKRATVQNNVHSFIYSFIL